MRAVTPPQKDVGPRQPLLGEAVLRILQGDRLGLDGRVLVQPAGNRSVHAVGIERPNMGSVCS